MPDPTLEPELPSLRLALAMRGGVSLAVWIGGAVAEIDALRRCTAWEAPGRAEIYRKLLQVAGFERVEVDVLAGASAGGLNAVVYGTALSAGATIDGLGDIWADLGAIWKLLRPAPGRLGFGRADSLFQGDGYFYVKVREEIARYWWPPRPELAVPRLSIDLSATVLNPDPNSELAAAEGRGQFHFDRRPALVSSSMTDIPGSRDDPVSANSIAGAKLSALAMAARSTSSFPGAFEPAQFVSTSGGATDTSVLDMSAVFSAHRDARTPYRVVDGGVFDNQPIDRAVQAIQAMAAVGPTRRSLLFLNPEPTPEPSGPPLDPGVLGRLPAVLQRAVTLLFRREAVGDEILRIDQHNAHEDATRARIAALAVELPAPPPDELYLSCRAEADTTRFVDLFTRPAASQIANPGPALDTSAFRVMKPERALEIREQAKAVYALEPADDVRGDVRSVLNATHILLGRAREIEASTGGTGSTVKATLYRIRSTVRMMQLDAERAFLVPPPWAGSMPPVNPLHTHIRALQNRERRSTTGDFISSVLDPVTPESFWSALDRLVSGNLPAGEVNLLAALWAALETCRRDLADLSPADPGVLGWIAQAGSLQEVQAVFEVHGCVPSPSSTISYRVISGSTPSPIEDEFEQLRAGARRLTVQRFLRDPEPSGPRILDDQHLDSQLKLAGNASHFNFSGFLSTRWRRNDWVWGRADAAANLVDVILDAAPAEDVDDRLVATFPTKTEAGAPPEALDVRRDLKVALQHSVFDEHGLDRAGRAQSTEGVETLGDLPPAAVTGILSRAAHLAFCGLTPGKPIRRWRLREVLTVLAMIALRPLFVLAPVVVNRLRLLILGAGTAAGLAVAGWKPWSNTYDVDAGWTSWIPPATVLVALISTIATLASLWRRWESVRTRTPWPELLGWRNRARRRGLGHLTAATVLILLGIWAATTGFWIDEDDEPSWGAIVVGTGAVLALLMQSLNRLRTVTVRRRRPEARTVCLRGLGIALVIFAGVVAGFEPLRDRLDDQDWCGNLMAAGLAAALSLVLTVGWTRSDVAVVTVAVTFAAVFGAVELVDHHAVFGHHVSGPVAAVVAWLVVVAAVSPIWSFGAVEDIETTRVSTVGPAHRHRGGTMDTVDCPTCGTAVSMQARQTGGYGSKPIWVFAEHASPAGDHCPASLKSAAEVAGEN